MGVKEGMRTSFLNAPQSVLDGISLPILDVGSALQGKFNYLHFFTKTQVQMDDASPKLKRHGEPTGMLWLAWPTGKKLGTDLALPLVMRIGYSHELLESTCLSLDATLTGFKFTHPKKHKIYNNSYGQLKP